MFHKPPRLFNYIYMTIFYVLKNLKRHDIEQFYIVPSKEIHLLIDLLLDTLNSLPPPFLLRKCLGPLMNGFFYSEYCF